MSGEGRSRDVIGKSRAGELLLVRREGGDPPKSDKCPVDGVRESGTNKGACRSF